MRTNWCAGLWPALFDLRTRGPRTVLLAWIVLLAMGIGAGNAEAQME